jgi:long-chain-fatty-acid---luciferin-component ligase
VVTAGGWKRLDGERIEPAAFRAMVADALGLAGEDQVRDAFNQVELNSVVFECEQHAKHLPPWLFGFTRSVDTLAAQPSGTLGLLSFVDCSASSYPASIVSDDFGTVDEQPCACGRPGAILHIERRVARGFQRGCALALEAQS